jgi:predicted RNA-binding protein (virulence factor B family)
VIEIGKYNDLTILRETSIGLYLGDEEGEDVLLPTKYCPESFKVGDTIRVFVYLDNEARKVATNMIPKILLHEFAFLKVTAVESVGAFLDWGIVKELLVPFREQRQRMEVGRWYVVYMDIDEKTGRLYATNKIEKRLLNENIGVKEGEEVDLLVLQKSDLGFNVIVNHKYKGLIFENEVFREIHIGQKLTGYVKKIRDDNKIDISLHPMGFSSAKDPNIDLISRKLFESNSFLPLNDNSSPERIYNELGMSKKAFKRTIGIMYKEKMIEITEDGIKLLPQGNND